jgi:hypothetical protein
MKSVGILVGVLACAAWLVTGCSSSSDSSNNDGTGGTGGSAGSAGAAGTGGVAGDVSLEAFNPPEKNVIIGQVVTKSGIPLKGITVSIEGNKKGTTNYDGMYFIADVPASTRQVVTFSGSGYITTTRSVATYADGKAVVNAVMMGRVGSVAISGGTANFENGTVKLADGAAVDSNGKAATSVRVQMTPIDIKGKGINAAPGDFSATDSTSQTVQLETFGMAEFQLTDDSGQPLKIKAGANATLELLLPVDTKLTKGQKVPAWHFDEKTSRWIEEGEGEIVEYSQDATRLAFRADVGHFSSWNCDQPLKTTCIQGKILNCDGTSASGADMQANGLDYDGTSSNGANSSGEYCINVKRGAKVHLVAAANYGSQRLVNVMDVTSPDVQAQCPTGCMQQDIKLPCTPAESPVDCSDTYFVGCHSCVKGKVVDKSGNPAKAIVRVASGLTATSVVTAADGTYTAPAAEGSLAVITATAANKQTGQTSVTPKNKSPNCEAAPDIQLDAEKTDQSSSLDFTACPTDVGGVTLEAFIPDGADPAFANLNGAWLQVNPTAQQSSEGQQPFRFQFQMINTNDKSYDQVPTLQFSLDLPSAPASGGTYTLADQSDYAITGEAHSSVGGVTGMTDQTFALGASSGSSQPSVGSATITFDQGFSKTGDTVSGTLSVVFASACSPKSSQIVVKAKFSTKVGHQLGLTPSVYDVNAPEFKAWVCSMYDFILLGSEINGSKGFVQAFVQDASVQTDSNYMNGASYSWAVDKLDVTLYGTQTTLLFSVQHPVSGANPITTATLYGVGGDSCIYEVKTGSLNLETMDTTATWLNGSFDIMMTPSSYSQGTCPDQHITGQIGAAVCR